MYLGVSGSERSALCDRSAPRARASPKLASPRSSVRVIGDPRSGIRDLSAISFALSRALFSRTLLLFSATRTSFEVFPARRAGWLFVNPRARRAARRVARLPVRFARGALWGSLAGWDNTRELGNLPRARHSSNYAVSFTLRCYTATHGILSCKYKPTRATPTDTRASSKHPVRRARGLPRPLMTFF